MIPEYVDGHVDLITNLFKALWFLLSVLRRPSGKKGDR